MEHTWKFPFKAIQKQLKCPYKFETDIYSIFLLHLGLDLPANSFASYPSKTHEVLLIKLINILTSKKNDILQ